MVQFGLFGDEGNARRHMAKLGSAQNEVLGDVTLRVTAVTYSGNRTFYRLETEPLTNKTLADGLCRRLKSKRVDCYVRPADG